ncbi:hypothetical protein UCDDA912_g02048 [Diaporthe ampelina]|uniref:chitinase n=1 Tax=Diaporthe ampelina TaxID=1214573 RepID=A0A0G2FVD6_9PEZI|nr:hypothetical protein UCDDA912_g02048 [Diaporthe ampelina]
MKTALLALLADAAAAASGLRYVMYYDQYHNLSLPDPSLVSEVTHAVVAFATPETFLDHTNTSKWEPFEEVQSVKNRFGPNAKVCLSIGGWGSNTGFEKGSLPAHQASYASNIASVIQRLGFDCVDIDWEYPGGGGADYKLENAASSSEEQIKNYPSFLGSIKTAIGNGKELSIAVPGLDADMGAFTPATCQAIVPHVDFVNVMSYDLMNRRSKLTEHHASVTGSKQSMSAYIKNGIPAAKLNLGFPFYAKWFTLQAGAHGRSDDANGGQWYIDQQTNTFWTWDTPMEIAKKFTDIVAPLQLGGIMAWSFGEDSHDYAHIKALQVGYRSAKAPTKRTNPDAEFWPTTWG